MNRSIVTDFDSALTSGFYLIGDYGRKNPGNPGIEYGVLLVFRAKYINGDIYTVQQAFNIYNPKGAFWRCFSAESGKDIGWNSFYL